MREIPSAQASSPNSKSHGLSRLRSCVSFPVLLAALLLLAAYIIARPIRLDPDTWWHLKLGEEILATHHLPTADTFSFTAHGVPWLDYEWLGDVSLALAYKAGALRALAALLVVLTGAILILIYLLSYVESRNAKSAFLATVLTIPLAATCFTLRPQLLGYIFLASVLICLELFRAGRSSAIWFLPPIFLLWVNAHGSYPLGFIVIAIYWASGLFGFSWGEIHATRWEHSQRRKLELSAVLSGLALLANPYGLKMILLPFQVATRLPINFSIIDEWKPINFGQWQAKEILLLLFLLLVAHLILRSRIRLELIALLAFATCSTFVHYRFVVFFALVVTPIFASLLARWSPPYEAAKDQYALNLGLIVVLISAIILTWPAQSALDDKTAEDYPVRAVAYLRQHPSASRMFNAYGYGGYLVWSLGPAHQVFIDGRGDLYENAGVLADYAKIAYIDPNALPLLQRYGIDSCLIQEDSPLATLLSVTPGWTRTYFDGSAAIYSRSTVQASDEPKAAKLAMPERDAPSSPWTTYR